MKKTKFKKVYYVLQTQPFLMNCGFTFYKRHANLLATEIGVRTGKKGKIISFTRQELQTLDY